MLIELLKTGQYFICLPEYVAKHFFTLSCFHLTIVKMSKIDISVCLESSVTWRHEEGKEIEVMNITLLTLPLFLEARKKINIHWRTYYVPGSMADNLHM